MRFDTRTSSDELAIYAAFPRSLLARAFMSALRLRVSTESPLPDLKAWFPVRESRTTVLSLKKALCLDLAQLSEARVDAANLVLVLDGFELLDQSRVADVIRDGEIISLRSVTHKRKAANVTSPPRKKAKLSTKIMSHSESTSTESTSSSGDSSSSSDSSSGSGSSDSSDSDSSDSSSSSSSIDSPPERSSKLSVGQQHDAATARTQSRASVANHVPPGQGKSSTHSRNLRRRKKRLYDRQAASLPSMPLTVPSVNFTPLGQPQMQIPPGRPTTGSTGDMPDMMSLSNKNKRRGFKKAMADFVPQHITFDEADGALSQVEPRLLSPSKQPCLVPPSEKQALGLLPPGMFVTSVDVEEGMWEQQGGGWDRRRKKKQRDLWGHEEESAVELPYEDVVPEEDASGTAGGINWDEIESRWDSLLVGVAEQLVPGSFALGVHPTKLTPEMIINLARVMNVDPDAGVIVLRPVSREASFGDAGGRLEDGYDSGEEVVHKLEDANALSLRVVIT
ncbi:hypothetical protein K488DRAFT_88503 [Vararia minispora EC-137]|uniref:Uncharacterized protein n=1 Tax=Vararia minispora EC-137 TaxID=1314806 RepID=A0ACB8QDL0_9AGAM|nr:hypothetical protein K488DRAFT_88503 [Vararia minispora EC-137]